MDREEQSKVLLDEVLNGAQMGRHAVELLRGKTEDKELIESLDRQAEKYRAIERDAEEKLRAYGVEPEKESGFAKAGLWTGIQMQTLFDRSTEHLEEMLKEGHEMGQTQMETALNRFPDADDADRDLAERMAEMERDRNDRP